MKPSTTDASYSQFACIGSGFSAIILGAQLQRWYGITDVRFFEQFSDLGGTWFTNQYPGAACDIPAALYSISFEPNKQWTQLLPSRNEIWEYLKRVSNKYNLTTKMTFNATVEKCVWINETSRWRLTIRHRQPDSKENISIHECQFLFSGGGFFTEPRALSIPGIDTFLGPVVHSSRWQPTINLRDKNIVVFGNGCTATQLIPAILPTAKHLTNIIHTKHWIFPAPSDLPLRRHLQKIPFFLPLQRLLLFFLFEKNLLGFFMTKSGARYRYNQRTSATSHILTTAPTKYHPLLLPTFEPNCKRRITDVSYLRSLHSPNLTLTDSQPSEILPASFKFPSGDTLPADVIILANGFNLSSCHSSIHAIGREGKSLADHWEETFSGPGAYNCTAMSGFPNFFLIVGPNSLQGHTSVVIAAENTVNYALRILGPILTDGTKGSVVEVKRSAEEADVRRLQEDLSKTVYFSGCQSWYIHEKGDGKRWNGTTYPYSQGWFWYRCLVPRWGDWEFSVSDFP